MLAPTAALLPGGAGGNLDGLLRSSEGLESFGWDISLKSLGPSLRSASTPGSPSPPKEWS